jgi:hypothetical protein
MTASDDNDMVAAAILGRSVKAHAPDSAVAQQLEDYLATGARESLISASVAFGELPAMVRLAVAAGAMKSAAAMAPPARRGLIATLQKKREAIRTSQAEKAEQRKADWSAAVRIWRPKD